MMSFRPAKDQTYITQLLGRMVRTPLARRIPGNDRLNSVSCMLPSFDKATAQKVADALSKGDGEGPPLGRILVNPKEMKPNPAATEAVWKQFGTLPSQTRPQRSAKPPIRLTALAQELSQGRVELPSVPDICIKMQRALADENVSNETVVKVLGAEPVLASKLLNMANSAALNTSGRKIADLRMAVARVGFNIVRSAALSFAVEQLKCAAQFKHLVPILDGLWKHSVQIAALSHVVARRFTSLNGDTALLTGLMHNVGRIYILTRASNHPALFADQLTYQSIVRDWHASIAKALLENWEMTEEIVQAVSEFEDLQRTHTGPTDLTDVLTVGNLLAAYRDHPESIELNMQGVAACTRMQLDRAAYDKLLSESKEEISAIQAALGS
jgi:HD-like signal output (HDOD) protein